MDLVSGYVLAGGQSSRMGEDKALLSIRGQTLIERAADALASIAGSITIVGLRSDHNGRSSVIADSYPGRGSIVGLYTALADCKTELAAVLACDLPFVDSELLSQLVASIGDQDAAMPRQNDGRLQPLCSVYRAAKCLPIVEKIITSDNWRLQQLGEMLDVTIVEPTGVRWSTNVNTPDDLRRANEIIS